MKRAPSIAIIGAGLGGLALGVKLKQAGIDSFTIFEKSEGPGGTWWDNTYPGAGCDIPAHYYSYSFMTYDWSRTHPSFKEIVEYIQAVIDRFGLRPHLRFKTPVREAVWDEAAHRYTLHIQSGEMREFDVVVSSVGMLNVPNYPSWPGLEDFYGPKFHTARWEHQHDLSGKRVAVVGTGSTTAQVVPAIAPTVGQLYVFQREPGWIAPKNEREFTAAEREKFRRWPILQRWERLKLFWSFESLRSSSSVDSKAQRDLRQTCERQISELVNDPALRAKVTPTHDVFCKRPILSCSFYPTLNRPNVELVPQAVVRVTRKGVVDASGVEREIDALIMATGFRAADYLATIKVKGRNGIDLHEAWAKEPAAFLGLAVPKFPNFFMMYGPGTNGGSIIFKLECQAEWITRVIKRMRRSNKTAVEIKPAAYQRFNKWLDRNNSRMAWRGGCHNYFTSPTGRIVTQWPAGQAAYWLMIKVFNGVVLNWRYMPESTVIGREILEKNSGFPEPSESKVFAKRKVR